MPSSVSCGYPLAKSNLAVLLGKQGAPGWMSLFLSGLKVPLLWTSLTWAAIQLWEAHQLCSLRQNWQHCLCHRH